MLANYCLTVGKLFLYFSTRTLQIVKQRLKHQYLWTTNNNRMDGEVV